MRLSSSKVLILLWCCFLLAPPIAFADVRLPALIGDNMVLQRGLKVSIWGTAEPGEQVNVALGDQNVAGTADDKGRWKVQIGPLKEGGPFEMTVTGKNTLTVHNILVGEVWVCSGQSNMEMSVAVSTPGWKTGVVNYQQEVAAANYPSIRMFTVKKAVTGQPQGEVEGQWVVTSPQTVGEFSAVGYFFGREVHRALGVPMGLIHTSWGGTPAESWTSAATLKSDPEFKPILDRWEKSTADFPDRLRQFHEQFDAWKQSAAKAEAKGRPVPPLPKLPDDPRSSPWRPAGLYNAMLVPLIPYAIRGAIWYQGESNSDRAYQYRKLFPAMIRDWREAWGQGEFPFLFVQLANFVQTFSPKDCWAELREAQLLTLSLPKTGMAVAADIGDPYDIHPKNKQDVGRRLALAAQAIAYEKTVVYSGPIYEAMSVEASKVRLRFKHADGGLVAKGGKPLKGFEIAGEDRKFVPAQAKINAGTVVVFSDQVPRPVAVRYAWADNPDSSLYNKAGLPASPFRTDDWPGVTADKR